MNIELRKVKDNQLKFDSTEIILKYNSDEKDIQKLIEHIEKFEEQKILVYDRYEIKEINVKDIMYFFSDKKYNYCKIIDNKVYEIRKKLYELEKLQGFVRISKSFIANLDYIESIEKSNKGKINFVMMDNRKEIVSRRRIKTINKIFEDRSI